MSLTAIGLAAPVAIGVAFLLAYGRFPGRRLLITLTYTSGRPREVRRQLNIPKVPSWANLPIQKSALEGVVGD